MSVAILVLMLFGAGTCLAQQPNLPGPTVLLPAPSSAPFMVAPAGPAAPITDEHYRLGTGDKLRVNVYGEEDLSGEFLVDGSGQVQLPLVGTVKAAGLTIHEFVGEVIAALKEGYLKDLKVSVEALNYRPFYIMGEVNKPGEYPFENGLNVLGAIALAGGYTYRANDNDIYVRRVGSTDEESMPADSSTSQTEHQHFGLVSDSQSQRFRPRHERARGKMNAIGIVVAGVWLSVTAYKSRRDV